MLAQSRVRACLATVAVAVLLAGCGVPPLHRSVVVETDSNGVPVHASGEVADHHYTVARGDTIYSIAVRTNLDYHQLARWNGIGAPYIIHPGQVLRLTRPHDMPPRQAQAPVFHTVSSGQSSSHEPAPVLSTATSAATSPAIPASAVVAVAGQPPVATSKADTAQDAAIPSGATRSVGGIRWRWPAEGKVLNRFNAASANPGINIGGRAGEPVRAAANGIVVYSGNGLVGYGELVVIKHSDDYLSIYGHNSKRLVKEGEHVEAGQIIARMGSTGAPRDELEFQVRYKGKPVDPLDYLPKQ
ncbi:MAG TPA: peptidoglycan DD-metalloendopeptidase family protein [Rhodanobacteraceae bacterium]|nr:peptidoglycan DD-metalloendopeptidase family protein [Rhodanobacteraceae bacterium]